MKRSLKGIPGVGEVVADKYRLDEVIGQGAAGVVFEATHELIGRVVALKWLYPHLAFDEVVSKRFLREARAACAIDHPNVVDVFDAGRDRDSLYLVMERLYGESLAAIFERGVKDPTALVATLMPALRGIAAAHEAGVVHRDLKPDNIIIARPRRGRLGGAKVLDFGISKLHDGGRSRPLTNAGMMMGSPYYMAPEQIADSSKVDVRADVYSIGVMLYEGLTGSLPFDAESLAQLFFRITNEEPPPIHLVRSDVPAALEAAVIKAMSALPKDRFDSVLALAAALEPFAQGVTFIPAESEEELATQPTSVNAVVKPPQEPEGVGRDSGEIDAGPTQVSFRTAAGGDGDGRTTDPEGLVDTDPERAAIDRETRDAGTVPEMGAVEEPQLPRAPADIGELETVELDRGEILPDEVVEEARKFYEDKRAEKERAERARAQMLASTYESTDVYPRADRTLNPKRRLPWAAVVGATVLLAALGVLVVVLLT